MSNKKLILIFVGLLVVYLLSRAFFKPKQSTFDTHVVSVDTAAVTKIELHPKAEEGMAIVLNKNGTSWTATMNDKTVNTPSARVSGVLGQLSSIESRRIVSRSEDQWGEYEVDDQGSRVEVYQGDKKVADFVVGAFKFDQAKRTASSYVRPTDKDDVYLVDGFLSMTFNQRFNTFRDNALVRVNKDDILEFANQEGGERIAVSRNPANGHWYRGGMEQLDSAKTAQYLSQIANLTGSEFADGPADGTPIQSFELSGNNLPAPVRVDCYVQADSTYPFILHSSMNPDNWFLTDSASLYQRIFGKFEDLLITE